MKNILKNKKFIIILAICIFIIAVLIFGIFILINKQPANYVDKMFKDIKSGDAKIIARYIKTDKISVDEENSEETEEDEQDDNGFSILLAQMDYDIISSKKSGNTGKVVVSVTNKNINTTLRNYFSNVFSEMLKNITSDEDSENLDSKLNDYLITEYTNAETVTTDIEISLVKEADGWKVAEDENDEYANGNKILNAILPGYIEYIDGLNYDEVEEE